MKRLFLSRFITGFAPNLAKLIHVNMHFNTFMHVVNCMESMDDDKDLASYDCSWLAEMWAASNSSGSPPNSPNSSSLFSPNSSDLFSTDGSKLLSPSSSGLLSPNSSGRLSLPPLAGAVFPINHSNSRELNYSKDLLPPCAILPHVKHGTSQPVQLNGRFFVQPPLQKGKHTANQFATTLVGLQVS